MAILPGQILSQFFWTGTGTGTITAGAAVPGSLLPGTDLNGQTVGYNIANPDTPAEVEVGQGVWNSGASTLTRAVIWVNALAGTRNPSASAINYATTNAKIVTLVALPADFGALAALAAVGTAQITDAVVTNAKLANMAAGTVKARVTGSGVPEDKTVGTGLTLDITSLRVNPAAVDHDTLQNFVANKHVDHSGVTVAGQQSVAGSGAITASVTLNLVNDSTTPGTNKVYGTDGSGVRGWKADPVGAGASLPTDDTTSIARDPVDGTRQMRIDVGAVATSTVRVLTMGNRDVNLASGGTFPELAHTHDTAEIVAGAVQGDKIYATADTAAAPSGGVSTNTLSAAADFLIATNASITSIRINNPAAKRNIAVLNSTGAAVTVANAAGTDIIGATLPNACVALLSWTGSAWTFKTSLAGGTLQALLPPQIAQHKLLARLTSGTGVAEGISDADLTEEATPASGDKLLGWVGGALRKFDAALIPGTSGTPFDDVDDGADYSVTAFEVGSGGAPKNEQRRFTGNQNHLLRFTDANLANGDFGWLIRGGTGTVTLVYNDIPLNNGTASIGLKSKVKWSVHDGEVLIDGGTNEPVDFDGVIFKDSELQDHCETTNALGNVSGALSVNYELGHDVTLTLTGNATSLAITNPPASGKAGWITMYINHGTGPFTWAHPTGVKHADNTAPTLSAVASRRSVLTYVTLDGGSTWLSFLGGKDIPT